MNDESPLSQAPETTAKRSDHHRTGALRPWRGHRYFIEHRAVCFALDAVLPRTAEPIEPSAFGLSAAEIRAHGNDLYRVGWSVEEIRAVLDIDPVAT
jgi:hypothetical protein